MQQPDNVICFFCREPASRWIVTKDHPAGCAREMAMLNAIDRELRKA